MSRSSLHRAARRRGRLVRVALWSAAVLVVGGVIAVLAAYAWVKNYLAGEEFRGLLAGEAGKALGAEVSIEPLVWDRLAVRTPSVKAQGGTTLSRLEITDPQATISLGALTSGVWVVENASIGKLIADLKSPGGKTPSPESPLVDAPVPEDTAPALAGLPGWFPTKVRVPQIQIREASVRFGQGDMDFRILQTGALVTSRDESSHDVAVRGGQFRLSPFPGAGVPDKSFAIVEGNLRLTPEKIFLLDSLLKAEDGTLLRIDGSLPGPKAAGAMEMHYVMDSLPVAQVLGAEWANRIFGRLSLNGTTTGEGDKIIHEGTAELADARFITPPPAATSEAGGVLGMAGRGFQTITSTFIPVLGAYTDRTVQFRNLVCDSARCRYRKEGENIVLSDIHVRSRALLGIEGTLDIKGRELDGRLMVGVSRETLSGIPGAESKVFTIEREGLVWTDVRLTGTLDEPKEDLTARLIDAAGARILEELPTLDLIKATLDGITPPLLKEGAEGVLEGGGKLLEEGGKLLDGVLPLPR